MASVVHASTRGTTYCACGCRNLRTLGSRTQQRRRSSIENRTQQSAAGSLTGASDDAIQSAPNSSEVCGKVKDARRHAQRSSTSMMRVAIDHTLVFGV